jgi:hypothetical protein
MQAPYSIVMRNSERTGPKRLGYVAGQPQNCGRFKSLTFLEHSSPVCPGNEARTPPAHAQASGTVWLSFPGRVKIGNQRVSVIAKKEMRHSTFQLLASNQLLSGKMMQHHNSRAKAQ